MALDAFTFPASETHVPSSSSSLASRAVAAAAAQAAAAAAAAQAKTFVTLPFQRDLSQPTYGRSRHSSLDSGGAASFEVAFFNVYFAISWIMPSSRARDSLNAGAAAARTNGGNAVEL